MAKFVSLELKDRIIDHILEVRNDDMFTIENTKAEELFGLNLGLLFSFLKELESLGFIRNLSKMDTSVLAFTVSSLDTFYENGGFVKHYSIKQLLEDRLLYEVNQLLENEDRTSKDDILNKLKTWVPIIADGIKLVTVVVDR